MPITCSEVNLSDAARRLQDETGIPFTYKDIASYCKVLGIDTKPVGPGRQRVISADRYEEILGLASIHKRGVT